MGVRGAVRPLNRTHSQDDGPPPAIWWTEWGVTPTHFAPVNDAVFGAPFVLRGVKAAMETAEVLAYWVTSDHFEELGWPARLFHGGFGLLTIGNLRKPRFWALELLGRLGPEQLPVEQHPRPGQGERRPAPAPHRHPAGRRPSRRHLAAHPARLDALHGNILATWRALGAPDWPDPAGWRALRAADRLDPATPARDLPVSGGTVELDLDLPMPGVALVRLTPATQC